MKYVGQPTYNGEAENLTKARQALGTEMVRFGETQQEVGSNVVAGSAVMAVTPASPASPLVATAGGITTAIGAGVVFVGDIMEDGELSMTTLENTATTVVTRGANQKVKGVINKTNILGKDGNSFFNNMMKSVSDLIFTGTAKAVKEENR